MPFCVRCGTKVPDGAKFCHKCGTPVVGVNGTHTATRQQEFSGKLYKCPNCGEILKSFVSNCPSCGFELREVKVTSTVKEFARKLEAIEARRETVKPAGFFEKQAEKERLSKTDEQKIALIKNFPIPNTKEDILEFMILATSNIDFTIYGTIEPNASQKALTEAWNAKVKQVYVKAKNSFGADQDFGNVQELYDACNADRKKQKKKQVIKWALAIGWLPLAWVFIIANLIFNEPKKETKELERLDAIVVDVQDALEKGEYKLALRTADSIDYQRSDSEMERKWDIQREYWVDEVLEAANENGVSLAYTYTEDVDNANNKTEETESPVKGGFVSGFLKGVKPGLDKAKENVEEFVDIMNGQEDTTGQTSEQSDGGE